MKYSRNWKRIFPMWVLSIPNILFCNFKFHNCILFFFFVSSGNIFICSYFWVSQYFSTIFWDTYYIYSIPYIQRTLLIFFGQASSPNCGVDLIFIRKSEVSTIFNHLQPVNFSEKTLYSENTIADLILFTAWSLI